MTFRMGETKDFPIDLPDRIIWFGIIKYDGAAFSETSFTASKSGKKDLIAMIELLTTEKRKFEVIGIWQGKWKTDIFILEPELLIKRLREVI